MVVFFIFVASSRLSVHLLFLELRGLWTMVSCCNDVNNDLWTTIQCIAVIWTIDSRLQVASIRVVKIQMEALPEGWNICRECLGAVLHDITVKNDLFLQVKLQSFPITKANKYWFQVAIDFISFQN